MDPRWTHIASQKLDTRRRPSVEKRKLGEDVRKGGDGVVGARASTMASLVSAPDATRTLASTPYQVRVRSAKNKTSIHPPIHHTAGPVLRKTRRVYRVIKVDKLSLSARDAMLNRQPRRSNTREEVGPRRMRGRPFVDDLEGSGDATSAHRTDFRTGRAAAEGW